MRPPVGAGSSNLDRATGRRSPLQSCDTPCRSRLGLSLSLFLPCESNDVSLHLLAWSSQTFLALILHWLVGKSVNKWGKHWRRLVSNCEEFFGL